MNFEFERNGIIIETIKVDVADRGHVTNCYLVYDKISKYGIVIDPGYNGDEIISEIKRNGVTVEYIVLTHCHGDHIGALEAVQKYTNAEVIIHENDLDGLYDDEKNHSASLGVDVQNIDKNCIITVNDDNVFECGDMELEVMHTPGHTSGCICIYERTANVLFTGDTIFMDCYGRTDLKSGSFAQMESSIAKIFKRFKNIEIYPGHDEYGNIEGAKKRINLLLAIKSRK